MVGIEGVSDIEGEGERWEVGVERGDEVELCGMGL